MECIEDRTGWREISIFGFSAESGGTCECYFLSELIVPLSTESLDAISLKHGNLTLKSKAELSPKCGKRASLPVTPREILGCASTAQLARLKAIVWTSLHRIYIFFGSLRPTIQFNIFELRVTPASNSTKTIHKSSYHYQPQFTKTQIFDPSTVTSRYGEASQDLVWRKAPLPWLQLLSIA